MHRIRGIGGWQKNSFIDFPGKAATVLFFGGCNLRCPYCHNPSLFEDMGTMEERSNEVWDFLQKRRSMIDGVVLSGGEPTLQPDIVTIANSIRNLGYKIKLDTNGLKPETIREISPDYLALDIKTIPENYKTYLNCRISDPQDQLKESISIVKSMGYDAEIRITLAPGIVTVEDIEKISELISGVKNIFLQRFNDKTPILDMDFFSDKTDITDKQCNIMLKHLKKSAEKCSIRNE